MSAVPTLKRLLVVLVALGVLASGLVLWSRSQTPQGGPETEIVVRLETLYESSRLHGVPVDVLLERLREAGLTTVAVEAKSLARLEYAGQAAVVPGAGEGLYSVAARRADLAPWLADELEVWAPRGRVETGVEPGTGGQAALAVALPATYPAPRKDRVPLPAEVLATSTDPLAAASPERDLVLGLSPADVELVRSHGLLAMAFIPNRPGLSVDEALFALRGLGDGRGFSAVWFDGPAALGYPDEAVLRAVGERLRELGLPFVTVDGQAGLGIVAAADDWRGLRWQPVWLRTEPERFPEVARERRATVLYLQTSFFDGTSPDWLDQVASGISALATALRSEGLVLGETVPLSPYSPAPWQTAVVTAGILAACLLGLVLVLEPLGSGPSRWLVAALGVAGIAAALVAAWGPADLALKGRVLAAFLAALAFPLLGTYAALRRAGARATGPDARGWAGPLLRALGTTVAIAGITVAGGFATAAVASDTLFMLAVQPSVGVRLTLLAAPVLAGFLYLGMVGLYPEHSAGGGQPVGGALPAGESIVSRGSRQLARFLAEKLTVGYVVLFALAGVVGLVYLTRSGNFPIIPVASTEEKIRAFLQQALLVRPRTKEFLIGYPALVLLLYWGRRLETSPVGRWLGLILAVAASIGLVSIGNSFDHLHVPVSVSVRRTVNGLALGLPMGVLAVGLASVAAGIDRRLAAVGGRRERKSTP